MILTFLRSERAATATGCALIITILVIMFLAVMTGVMPTRWTS